MTVAWFIQHLLQLVFAFFNHSIKIAQFLCAGVISFPFQAILTDDAFRHRCKRMTSYPMTQLSYTHVKFFRLSLCKNEILSRPSL